MKRGIALLGLVAAVAAAAFAALLVGHGPSSATASSHREAPLIADDPTADNTDLYAFVSPDASEHGHGRSPTTSRSRTPPAARTTTSSTRAPRTRSRSTTTGDAEGGRHLRASASRRRSGTRNTFLYNTGPVASGTDANLNVKQTYSVTRIVSKSRLPGVEDRARHGHSPCRPRTSARARTPTYDPYGGVKDLGGRPQGLRRPARRPVLRRPRARSSTSAACARSTASTSIPLAAGRRASTVCANYNVHAIALQVPKTDLVKAPAANGTIGIYATASRPKLRILGSNGTLAVDRADGAGLAPRQPARQRGDHPARQEGLLERARTRPTTRSSRRYYRKPELTGLVNALYPPLPDAPTENRDDLVAVLLTGVPSLNYTGADPGRPAPPQHGDRARPASPEHSSAPSPGTSRASRTAVGSPTT